MILRKAVYAILSKHPGKDHDQSEHNPKRGYASGVSVSSELKDADGNVFGKHIKQFSKKTAEKTLLAMADKGALMTIDPRSGDIRITETEESHEDFENMLGISNQVRVRGYRNPKGEPLLRFSTTFAGEDFGNANISDVDEKAMNNIYRAMDSLKAKGMPKKTLVKIGRTGLDVITTDLS